MTTLDIADRVIAQRKVKASALKPAPWNWRTHPEEQRAVMRGLLKEIGFAGAVLARELEDKSLELIDGHLRIEELGDREIAVTITDLTEDEAKALNLVHDPVGRLAGTDAAKLEELLQSVQFDDEALQKLTQDMTDLLGVIPEPPPIGAGGDEFDATPETSGPTRTAVGDLWLIGGKHRLLVGDCTDAGNVVMLMDGKKAEMIWTDPPYGVNYEGGRNPESNVPRKKLAGDSSGELYRKMFSAWVQACKGSAPWYIWFAGTVGEPVYSAIVAAGYKVRAMIVWNKLKAHYGNFMAQYMQKHEPCLYCVNEAPPWFGPTNEVTVWDIDQPSKNEHHPTQKPLELAFRAMKNSSEAGALIADPFLGSGTTLIAAHRLGRVCYGCEIEPRYGDVILKRAEAEGLTVEKIGTSS